MRHRGTKAQVVAYLALASKAMGYPRAGVEVGPGPHVQDPAGGPFQTRRWDEPRKHPKRNEWDCAALDTDKHGAKLERLSTAEKKALADALAAAKPAPKDWEPAAGDKPLAKRKP